MVSNNEMILSDHSGRWAKLDDHEDDLTCGFYDNNGKYLRLEEYDIVKIYGYSPQPVYALDLRPLERPLIREEENVSM
jgi:hypothetical protein